MLILQAMYLNILRKMAWTCFHGLHKARILIRLRMFSRLTYLSNREALFEQLCQIWKELPDSFFLALTALMICRCTSIRNSQGCFRNFYIGYKPALHWSTFSCLKINLSNRYIILSPTVPHHVLNWCSARYTKSGI